MWPFSLSQPAISLSARPITAAEFSKALLKKWVPQHHGQPTLGLAISGGVDSMALAALCSQLQNPPHSHDLPGAKEHSREREFSSRFNFQAFIVDHGLRNGSDVEAKTVAKILKEREIRTQILKIEWPGQTHPASLPNFESLARKYRYRLLGRACRDSGIRSLLLAHHEDDQVETVFMRLADGQRANGLLGMQSPAGIPECYGIHGVYESGGDERATGKYLADQERSNHAAIDRYRPDSFLKTNLPCETGGIQIHRPFLNFSKDRLIATCVAENVEWFEDPTNTMATTTRRNAIRHMYMKHSMPAALTKPAILALSTRLNEKDALRFDILKTWLAKCRFTQFETRTGIIKLRFANLTHFQKSENMSSSLDTSWVAAELLRQVIRLVTPLEQVSLGSLHNAVHRVFPELSHQDKHNFDATAFTASGVYFQPVQASQCRDLSPDVVNRKCEWTLSRQPHLSGSLPKCQQEILSTAGRWSPWHLYDGRYWIRIQNFQQAPLFIQPLMKHHLADFRASLPRRDEVRLLGILKSKAPGNIRWTLPAVVTKEKNGEVSVIALPSLDIGIPQRGMRWEIRYKKISHSDLLERDIFSGKDNFKPR